MSINASMIWRVRPSGNNANGGGFDPGVGSPGTDYSKQNGAQVAFNGTTVRATTAGVGATITLVGYSATAADIGNVLNITGGTNFTTGRYTITAQGGTTWTLDRNCTTGAGAAMTGNMGGGWADFWTNVDVSGTFGSSSAVVPGNIIYILGSGIPNPSSYTYDYTMTGRVQPPDGNTTAGLISLLADPDTPSYKAPPDTTGGMPCIKRVAGDYSIPLNNYVRAASLWLVASGAVFGLATNNSCFIESCVFDQFGFDAICLTLNSSSAIGCEVFNSGSPSAGGNESVDLGAGYLIGCNVHDVKNRGIYANNSATIFNCIVAKCSATGIEVPGTNVVIMNNTIDGNGGHGIEIDASANLQRGTYINNIISNHTGGGKVGLIVDTGTTAVNNALVSLADFNSFFNNTANYSSISAGPHDTALGVSPYVASSTENYALV